MLRKYSVLALVAVFVVACASSQDDPNKKAKEGAGIGAVAGAIAGAIIGNQAGGNRTGAVLGAVAGAAIGGAVGHRMDQQQKELQQIPGVDVTRTADNELDVALRNDVLFDVDSASLRSESQATLRDMAAVFNRYNDTTIDVQGYTDSTGTADHNMGLSQRRADSVRDYLSREGVSPSRISARGFGESNPKASNDMPDGRQLNRRVEIHVLGNPNS
jgi:outer membrane protein OmpA-like peptidoglycan-associated protein